MKREEKHTELGLELIEAYKEIIELEKGRKASKLSKDTVSILSVEKFQPEEIKSIRQKFEMSHSVFAKLLGVSTKTIEAWESGFRKPTGAYARLLQIITHDPKTVKYLVSKK
jgi:putative transcriptional regulator